MLATADQPQLSPAYSVRRTPLRSPLLRIDPFFFLCSPFSHFALSKLAPKYGNVSVELEMLRCDYNGGSTSGRCRLCDWS